MGKQLIQPCHMRIRLRSPAAPRHTAAEHVLLNFCRAVESVFFHIQRLDRRTFTLPLSQLEQRDRLSSNTCFIAAVKGVRKASLEKQHFALDPVDCGEHGSILIVCVVGSPELRIELLMLLMKLHVFLPRLPPEEATNPWLNVGDPPLDPGGEVPSVSRPVGPLFLEFFDVVSRQDVGTD